MVIAVLVDARFCDNHGFICKVELEHYFFKE